MAERLSQGPFQVSTLDIASINSAFAKVRQELDELRGLRGEVKLQGALTVPTSINVIQTVTTTTSSTTTTPPPAVQINSQPLKHDQLGELTDDDHTQYALLAGRSGGQTLTGGTGSGDNLNLRSGGKIQVVDKVDIQNALQLSGDITIPQLTANVNDFILPGLDNASVFRFSSDASRNITGIAGGTDGRIVVIQNVGSNNIVLVDESTSSLAVNRFALREDITMAADVAVMLQYDATALRWRSLAIGAFGVSGTGAANQVTYWTSTTAVAGNDKFKVNFTGSGGAVYINTSGASAISQLVFQDQGSDKWAIYKDGSTGFPLFIRDSANAFDIMKFSATATFFGAEPVRAFGLTGITSPSQITADQNDYNPLNLSLTSTLRLSSDAARNITGLAGGQDGRIIIIHNVGANNIVLVDESASSTAANRFALTANITLVADQCVILQYDNTSARWRAISGPG